MPLVPEVIAFRWSEAKIPLGTLRSGFWMSWLSVPRDPQLNDLLRSLLGTSGVWGYSVYLARLCSAPLAGKSLPLTLWLSLQSCLWNPPSLPLPKATECRANGP